MHRDIIVFAFAKAKKEALKETGREGSNNKASERISAYISNESDIPYSSRSLRNALNDSLDPTKAVEILQPKVLNALCVYLGYENYQDYLRQKETGSSTLNQPIGTGPRNPFVKYYKWVALTGILILIAGAGYFLSNRQRWMEWDTNRYKEVGFDTQKLQEGVLKIYSEERIENFRKVSLTCDSVFFNQDGSPRFWYGKNNQKQLEFYTELGKHPETGKALKPLSRYMIDKYLCKE